MKIIISYNFFPDATAVYFEKAFKKDHEIIFFSSPHGYRSGYCSNEHVSKIISEMGNPDLLFLLEPITKFFPRGLEKVSCPTACYLIDVHTDLWVRERYAPFFDYIFIAQKDYVEHFKKLGYQQVYWLPLACDPEIHGKKEYPKIYDIGFVGNCFSEDHPRNKRLKKLSQTYRMNDYRRWYPKEEISSIYSQSKIVVNSPVNGDLNMRVFEVMASGALLLTETIGNGQKDLFKDGVHLIEFQNEEELFEKVAYYLRHEDERERIAKAGQELVLNKHTYKHRCDFILDEIFKKSKPPLVAKARAMEPRDLHVAYAKIYSMLRLVDPVLEEIKDAYNTKSFSFGLLVELIKSFLRAVNSIIPFTISARRIRKRQKDEHEQKK